MSELLHYLNSPNLVANFQKIFGIEANFNLQKKFLNCINQQTNSNKKNTKLKSRKKSNDNEQKQEQDEEINDLNKNKDNNNDYYKIHNKFWFYLFHIGAAMGKL